MKRFAEFGLSLLLAASLTGCGGSAPDPNAPKTPRGVYTSSTDCADAGKLKLEECSKLIEDAVAQHVAAAPSYTSLKACEKTEGPDRCERTDPKSYRPLLAAYLVTFSEPPAVLPLYPTLDGKPGFRDLAKGTHLDEDDSIVFSKSAAATYERYIASGTPQSEYNF